MRVLLTEDNKELADLTALNLKKYGFAVDIAYSGEEALRLLEGNGPYDVIILDLILPDIDGRKLFKEIKSITPAVPVLALTARGSEEERIKGLKLGFDDYVVKPFSHHELVARLRVLYRLQSQPADKIEVAGPLKIQPKNYLVFKNGTQLKLSLKEFRLLCYLAQNKNRKVTLEELLESVWDRNGVNEKAKVVTTISRLRTKIGDKDKKIIKTCEGGYTIGGEDE